MHQDPREALAKAPLSTQQIIAIGLCVLLNALDGFDVLSISFASPGIAAEWGINKAALGLVLSVELIGMTVGSILIGTLADRYGRRPATLASLILMGVGMALAPHSTGVAMLSGFRLLTGLGIGGMLACTNALVAEHSNRRARSLVVALMAAGYPMGAVAGGSVASMMLATGDWRNVFYLGAGVAVVLLPLVWFLLPETLDYLVNKRPTRALERSNALLARFGHGPVTELPAPEAAASRTSLAELFSPRLALTTILLCISYFAHILTFYFILKWAPKIVVDMGFAPSSAGMVLVWSNVGGLCGAVLLSLLSWRYRVRGLLTLATLFSIAMVTLFGRSPADLQSLAFYAALAGFCTNAGMVGYYALIAESYPAAVRGGGTGFVIGLGRGGAALSPIIAGFMFNAGTPLPTVAMVMATGSLIALLALLVMRKLPATA